MDFFQRVMVVISDVGLVGKVRLVRPDCILPGFLSSAFLIVFRHELVP
jgi:hypothetical protein